MLHQSGDISGIHKLKSLLVQYLQFNLEAIETSKSNTSGELISEKFHNDLCTCLEELVELVNNVLTKQGTENSFNLSKAAILLIYVFLQIPFNWRYVYVCVIYFYFKFMSIMDFSEYRHFRSAHCSTEVCTLVFVQL